MAAESSIALPATESGRTFFTPAHANRALRYVSRIVRDVRVAYRHAVALQQRLEMPAPEEDPDDLAAQYEQIMGRLNGYVDELHDVGVELKDYELGLIDFPAMHDGREVCLCWKYGEKRVSTWHELDEGFAGRQPVATLDTPQATD